MFHFPAVTKVVFSKKLRWKAMTGGTITSLRWRGVETQFHGDRSSAIAPPPSWFSAGTRQRKASGRQSTRSFHFHWRCPSGTRGLLHVLHNQGTRVHCVTDDCPAALMERRSTSAPCSRSPSNIARGTELPFGIVPILQHRFCFLLADTSLVATLFYRPVVFYFDFLSYLFCVVDVFQISGWAIIFLVVPCISFI